MKKLVSLIIFFSCLSTLAVSAEKSPAKIPTFNELRSATNPDIQHYLRSNPPPSLENVKTPPFERRSETAQAIRDQIRLGGELFNSDFWKEHPSYYPMTADSDIWQKPSWKTIKDWLTASFAATPFYFENNLAYPQDGEIDSQITFDIDPQIQDKTGDQWLPLGVFAMTRESKYFPAPKIFMQLALNKSGEIAGNLYDSAYDKTFPLIGRVESNTQRAVWKMLHSARTPIIETGIYNLTLDQTPVKFTYTDGRTEDFFLVRILPVMDSSKE